MTAPGATARPGPTLSRAEVRELDRRAIEEYGLPGIVLMENAGRGAAELVHQLRPGGGLVAIACGGGNNAGDGFVMARHLDLLGHRVRILLATDAARLSGDAAAQFAVATRAGIPIEHLSTVVEPEWRGRLADADVIVDALLGTGATGTPRGGVAVAIAAVNAAAAEPPRQSAPLVFAVDLPSGLDCDTGRTAGACVRADVTGTFVARKRGFDAPESAAFTGTVHVLSIGAPRRLLAEFGVAPC